MKYITEAYQTNWMSTIGENINEVERLIAEKVGCGYAVALSCGTASLHLATRLAGERLYGTHPVHIGSLKGRKVFCSDMQRYHEIKGGRHVPLTYYKDQYSVHIRPCSFEDLVEIDTFNELKTLDASYGV